MSRPALKIKLKMNCSVKKESSTSNMVSVQKKAQFDSESSQKVFPQVQQLKARDSANAKNRFVCNICNKTFANSRNFNKHSARHKALVARRYVCKICSKAFKRNDHLKNHHRLHTGDRPYKCRFCDKACAEKGNMIKHEKACERSHDQKARTRRQHAVEDLTFREATFGNDEEDLQSHESSLLKDPLNVCPFCKATFENEEELRMHEETHTGDRPFSCQLCKKSFTVSLSLRLHACTPRSVPS